MNYNEKILDIKKYFCMYALLLDKLQIEMKYFLEAFYIIWNHISKVALKEFISVFLLLLPTNTCIYTCM